MAIYADQWSLAIFQVAHFAFVSRSHCVVLLPFSPQGKTGFEMSDSTHKNATELRRERYRRAAELLRQWGLEDPEYDERVGAILNDELKKDSSLQCVNNVPSSFENLKESLERSLGDDDSDSL